MNLSNFAFSNNGNSKKELPENDGHGLNAIATVVSYVGAYDQGQLNSVVVGTDLSVDKIAQLSPNNLNSTTRGKKRKKKKDPPYTSPNKASSSHTNSFSQDFVQSNINNSKKRKCSCKNSKCLKLYCECFQAMEFCDGCNCTSCKNIEEHLPKLEKARKEIMERNPNAFKVKMQNKIVISKGCNCKKSSCLKKYCECYQAGQLCEDQCKCNDCKNRGSLSEVRSIKQATIDNYTKKTRSSKKLERSNQKLLNSLFSNNKLESLCEELFRVACKEELKYNFGPSINTQKQGNATNLFQAQEKEILEKFTSFLQEAFSSLNE